MPIKFERTDGIYSKTKKLKSEQQVIAIRKIYAGGGRGKDHARKFGITPYHFDDIGRGNHWKGISND